MRWGGAFVAVAILSACATKYQEMGLTGGVRAEPVMTDIYRIAASGNAYTSDDRVQDFALMKPAETTLAAGGNYFVIVNEKDRTQVNVGQIPATTQTNFVGNTGFTTYSPGHTKS